MKNSEHNNHSLETKLHNLKEVSLSHGEKERLSSFLSSYASLHPVLGSEERVRALEATPPLWMGAPARFAAAFVVLFFFVGGSVVMAERALPGDPLYGIKIAHENVRARLAFTTESRARIHTSRIERRLSEAQKLVAAGVTTDARAAELVRHFERGVADFEKAIAELKAYGESLTAFEMYEEYRSSLRIHGRLLAKLSQNDEGALALSGKLARRFESRAPVAPVDPKPTAEILEREAPPPDTAPKEDDAEKAPELPDDAAPVVPDAKDEAPKEGAIGAEGDVAVEEVYMAPFAKIGADVHIDTGTLRLYALSRIRDSESLVANSEHLSQGMRRTLLSKLERAFGFYTSGALEEARMNDRAAREAFINSVRAVEDVRTILRLARDAESESLLLLLLSRIEIRDDVQRVEILDSVIDLGAEKGPVTDSDIRKLFEGAGIGPEWLDTQ